MERPARVRMRSRKPWVLARRRLLGWNVRLDTRGSEVWRAAGRGRPPLGRYEKQVLRVLLSDKAQPAAPYGTTRDRGWVKPGARLSPTQAAVITGRPPSSLL